MPTTFRSHAGAWGTAVIAGLASLGLAAGPVSASTDTSSAPAATQAPQSSGYPTSAVEYADKLVSAYGNGEGQVMDHLATRNVVAALTERHYKHAERWHRTSADSGKGITWVSYTNLETQEVMNLTVRNSIAVDKGGDAVREIEFMD